METMLLCGLPAVFINGYWVVVSGDFTRIARINQELAGSKELAGNLTSNGFFDKPSAESPVSLVTLIVTSDCNLQCRYCFANSGEKHLVMSEKVALAAVRRGLANAKGKKLSIAFFGGEPTLELKLMEKVVAYAQEIVAGSDATGAEFAITTNGVFGSKVLDFLIRNKFKVNLSADGIPEVQDHQRPFKDGRPTSDIVARNIRSLSEAGISLKIRSTVTSDSVDSMVSTIEWLASLGGKRIQFEVLSETGRAMKKKTNHLLTRPEPEIFAKNLQAAILRGGELGVRIVNSSFMNIMNPPKNFCSGDASFRFAVSYNGEVTTCVEVQEEGHPAHSQFVIGRYHGDIDEIIFDKQDRGRACSSVCGKGDVTECQRCFAKNICGGGCPVRNFHTTGDSLQVDPYRCKLIKQIVPFIFTLLEKETYG
jgi:uncharacterized protein